MKQTIAILLSAIAVAAFPLAGHAAVIMSVSPSSGSPYVILPLGLDNNVLALTDRTFEWNDVPAPLVGADYIRTTENDDSIPSLTVDVALSSPATLYLFFSNGAGDPGWVATNGFTDSGMDIGLDSTPGAGKNIVATYSIFQKDVPAGVTRLFEAQGGSMYGIAAIPEPSAAVMFAVGLLAFGLLHRTRQT